MGQLQDEAIKLYAAGQEQERVRREDMESAKRNKVQQDLTSRVYRWLGEKMGAELETEIQFKHPTYYTGVALFTAGGQEWAVTHNGSYFAKMSCCCGRTQDFQVYTKESYGELLAKRGDLSQPAPRCDACKAKAKDVESRKVAQAKLVANPLSRARAQLAARAAADAKESAPVLRRWLLEYMGIELTEGATTYSSEGVMLYALKAVDGGGDGLPDTWVIMAKFGEHARAVTDWDDFVQFVAACDAPREATTLQDLIYEMVGEAVADATRYMER